MMKGKVSPLARKLINEAGDQVRAAVINRGGEIKTRDGKTYRLGFIQARKSSMTKMQ